MLRTRHDTLRYLRGRRAKHYSNTKPIPRSSLVGPVKVSLVSYGLQPVRGSVKYASASVMRCRSVSGLGQESLYACNVRCTSRSELAKRQLGKSLFVVLIPRCSGLSRNNNRSPAIHLMATSINPCSINPWPYCPRISNCCRPYNFFYRLNAFPLINNSCRKHDYTCRQTCKLIKTLFCISEVNPRLLCRTQY